jgi:hypothetical protein
MFMAPTGRRNMSVGSTFRPAFATFGIRRNTIRSAWSGAARIVLIGHLLDSWRIGGLRCRSPGQPLSASFTGLPVTRL